MADLRYYNFGLIFYPDCEKHNNLADIIALNYRAVVILHDKDVDDNGEIKKPHYHAIISFKNARTINSLSNELGLESYFIQPISNLKSSFLYLIHKNAPDKYQYDFDSLFGDVNYFEQRFSNVLGGDKDTLALTDIFEKIESGCCYRDLVKFCLEQGIISTLRKYQFVVRDYYRGV